MKYKLIVLVTAVLMAGLLTATNSNAAAKSKSWQQGYNSIIQSDSATLANFNIKYMFGLDGKPVKRMVVPWCKSLFKYTQRPYSAYPLLVSSPADWSAGCTSAVMTLVWGTN